VDKQDACLETWMSHANELPEVDAFFFTGQSPARRQGTSIALGCRDDYAGLPTKVAHLMAYVCQHHPDAWVFKCDDDTFVVPDRLVEYVRDAPDFSGFVAEVDGIRYASGGAGYLLSPAAVRVVAYGLGKHETGPEDVLVAQVLREEGIYVTPSDRFGPYLGHTPTPTNALITEHWVPPEIMRLRWQQFNGADMPAISVHDMRPLLQLSEDYSGASGWFGSALATLHGMAVGCGAKDMLETGVREGGSTRALLLAAELNDGHLTSIDCEDCSGAIPEDGRQRWSFLHGDSNRVLTQLHEARRQFDFAFLDGSTDYDRVLRDLRLVDAMIRPGGTILLDDCWPTFQAVLDAFLVFRSRQAISKTLIPYGTTKSWDGARRTLGLIRYV
jgi:hypothetical protein